MEVLCIFFWKFDSVVLTSGQGIAIPKEIEKGGKGKESTC